MNPQINQLTLDSAVEAVRRLRPDARPRCGVILGSGWADALPVPDREPIPYARIPGLGAPGVEGHTGLLHCVSVAGIDVLFFQGRRHWYEGAGWTPVILPVYLLHALGARTLLLTNAAGGIREDLEPGRLMAIADHINMLGGNPLIGPYNPKLGCRFPDQTHVYDPALVERLLAAGADTTGVYIAAAGPTFETPAEIRQFRAMGADVVGMSTVPEAILGNALGMQVAGLSCSCNWAAGIGRTPLTHEDVNRTARAAMPRMQRTIQSFLERLAGE